MRYVVSILLTVSFLLLTQDMLASSLSFQDEPSIVAAPAVSSSPKAQAQTSNDMQCYRRERGGMPMPLFDKEGQIFPDFVPPRGDPSVPPMVFVSLPLTTACAQDLKVLPHGRTLIGHLWAEGKIQPEGLAAQAFLLQTILLEYLAAEPEARNSLLRTCWYYRTFAMPYQKTGIFHHIPEALRTNLLVGLLAGQSGDIPRFLQDQTATFCGLPLQDLQEAVRSLDYEGTLSPKTPHGNSYLYWSKVARPHGHGHVILTLNHKNLRLLPPVSQVERVQTLILESNLLKVVPSLSAFTSLKTLDLSKNPSLGIDGLSRLTTLEALFLRDNNLKSIESLSSLTRLQNICLNDNQLTNTTGLSRLTALRVLYIESNQLTSIRDLHLLRALRYLSLSHNQLSSAQEVSNLTALEWLCLSDNQLTSIGNISGLTRLRTLSLEGNHLTHLEGHTTLTTLKNLNLSHNKLISIGNISALTGLATLSLGYNRLTHLEGHTTLTTLEELNLLNNKLTSIGNISALTGLTILNIAYNPLRIVPDVSPLRKLDFLYLDMSLCQDPKFVSNFKRLNKRRKCTLMAYSKISPDKDSITPVTLD